MKKIVLAFCLLGIFAKNLVAEQSGFMLGIGYNYGKLDRKVEFPPSLTSKTQSSSGGTFGFGALFGFKYFFVPKFGFRAYLDAEARLARVEKPAFFSSTTVEPVVANTSYGAYMDLLYNLQDFKTRSHGLFAGLGLVNTSYSKDIMSITIETPNNNPFNPFKVTRTTYSKAASNVGLVGNLGYRFHQHRRLGDKGYSLEFGVKYPFFETQSQIETPHGLVTATAGQNFNFYMRYIFSF